MSCLNHVAWLKKLFSVSVVCKENPYLSVNRSLAFLSSAVHDNDDAVEGISSQSI